MDKLVRATQAWTEKAAYMRSLKAHTRDLRQGESRPFSVHRIIEDTTLLLAYRLRLSQCALVVSGITEDLTLQGDPSKLGQVLTNLIVNAIDAYPDDTGGEIGLAIVSDPHHVEIQVRDHGCGISPAHLDKIFDEFFSTKRLGEGTGLGLSITRDIVANFFGGTITVTSTSGQGSTFIVRLPRHRPREAGYPSVVAARPPRASGSLLPHNVFS